MGLVRGFLAYHSDSIVEKEDPLFSEWYAKNPRTNRMKFISLSLPLGIIHDETKR